jgi:hypothetical protein
LRRGIRRSVLNKEPKHGEPTQVVGQKVKNGQTKEPPSRSVNRRGVHPHAQEDVLTLRKILPLGTPIVIH